MYEFAEDSLHLNPRTSLNPMRYSVIHLGGAQSKIYVFYACYYSFKLICVHQSPKATASHLENSFKAYPIM